MSAAGATAVALVGATATGKSALAHRVALEHGAVEVLCVDAMTVYRRMNIATAKPTLDARREVAYHLLDLIEPSDEFTLAQFQGAARVAAAGVWAADRSVLYVGGTGLYGRAVFDNFDIPGQYPQLRGELEGAAQGDLAALYQRLGELDPLAASRMEPTNARRIVRALEVTMGSGRAFSSFGPGLQSYGPVRVVQIGLRVEPTMLHARIEQRFRQWLEEGLVDEVAALAQNAHGLSRTARQAVGYRELLAHLEDGAPLEACVAAAITHSRRLARRQRAWFERDPRVEWFDDVVRAEARVHAVLNGPNGFVRD